MSTPIARNRALLLTLALAAAVVLAASGCEDDFFTKDIVLGVKTDDNGDGGGGGTEPQPDDDDDGLGNDVEEEFDLLPRVADTDSDGFNDGLEFVADGGDPLDATATPAPKNQDRVLDPGDIVIGVRDSDSDGLGDPFEEDNGLESDNPDMDGDGYGDGLELVAASDPFDSDSVPGRDAPPASDGQPPATPPVDQDGDGLANNVEGRTGSDLSLRDTDGDGFSDSLEFLMGADPDNAARVPNFDVPEPPETTTTTVTETSTSSETSTTVSELEL